MKVTKLSSQVKNPDRINVFIDDKYTFSLDISQITDLRVKVGQELNQEEVDQLKKEGEFSKYYLRALNYALIRPRSEREIRDYLYRQTRTRYYLVKGERRERIGMTPALTERIIDKLVEKGYLDDEVFARYWNENRNLKKGISQKVMRLELIKKGVSSHIIDSALEGSERNDREELKKVIIKTQKRYSDHNKFIKYLISKGYSYDLIQELLAESDDD